MSSVLIREQRTRAFTAKSPGFSRCTGGLALALQAAVFDLSADPRRAVGKASLGSSVAAILAHVAGFTALIAIPVSRVVTSKPEPPRIQAFVVTSDRLPQLTPQPPPAAAGPRPKSEPAPVRERAAVPSEAPIEIQPEPAARALADGTDGVDGGVDGGIAGGVVGGVAGGLGSVVAPAPPTFERARPRPAEPLRISGAIKPPDLLRRVDPVYSAIAAVSRISGSVILEGVVGVDGSVESVKTLQSSNPLLVKAATDALKQWQYAPLVLAGVPTPFVVVATFNFKFPGEVRTSTRRGP
jgi:periplasmic protein TonB